jgi:hypothetical protein
MSLLNQFVDRVELFLLKTGMAASRLGDLACNDPAFVPGRRPLAARAHHRQGRCLHGRALRRRALGAPSAGRRGQRRLTLFPSK